MFKQNPFEKYLGKEDHLQMQVCDYLNYQYPNVLWLHPANEGKRSHFERYKAKKLGLKQGFPDLLIFKHIHLVSYGLFIELKIKPNKCTANQLNIQDQLVRNGWLGGVCYSFDEAKELIDNYLK